MFRIVCMGDSWTFGTNVGQADAYPQRLATLLEGAFPEANFEVCNRGVMGYSSFQGLQLLRKNATAWKMDVVIIGYAMNDSKVSGLRDKDWIGKMQPRRAIVTNLHTDLDYEELRRQLPAHVEPAYDGMQIEGF